MYISENANPPKIWSVNPNGGCTTSQIRYIITIGEICAFLVSCTLLNSCVSNVLESRNLSHRSISHCSISFHPTISDFKWCTAVFEKLLPSRDYINLSVAAGFPESENRDARALIFQINRIKLR